ncbi:hypothetical protein ACFZCG_17440 [Streptomyces tanashiensis]|uniref:hypothetical protein n=1 Tax=Streptomyces tanashiensis TaxID=67367 RepID=UPI0036E374AD
MNSNGLRRTLRWASTSLVCPPRLNQPMATPPVLERRSPDHAHGPGGLNRLIVPQPGTPHQGLL